jgi:hypothetical protein
VKVAEKLEHVIIGCRSAGGRVNVLADGGQLIAHRRAVEVGLLGVCEELRRRNPRSCQVKDCSHAVKVGGAERPGDNGDGVSIGSKKLGVVKISPRGNNRIAEVIVAFNELNAELYLDEQAPIRGLSRPSCVNHKIINPVTRSPFLQSDFGNRSAVQAWRDAPGKHEDSECGHNLHFELGSSAASRGWTTQRFVQRRVRRWLMVGHLRSSPPEVIGYAIACVLLIRRHVRRSTSMELLLIAHAPMRW